MSEVAIRVDDVSKLYKLYDKPSDRLKESLGLTRKKLYKEHYALHNVSFDVKRGETVGIIGTNGSGKSTILKIITGVLNPSGGHVEIDGRISALLELGAGFNMEYTGIENIYLNGTMIGFSREEIDAKMQDILDFADIGDFVHQPVKTCGAFRDSGKQGPAYRGKVTLPMVVNHLIAFSQWEQSQQSKKRRRLIWKVFQKNKNGASS